MTTLIRRNGNQPVIGRLFNDIFSDPFFSIVRNPVFAMSDIDEGTLALDVSEDEEDVIIRASLPGYAREEIDVEMHDGVLTIKAEHTEETEETTEKIHRRERRFGSVSRSITLPVPIDENKNRGELKEGILTLRLRKAEKAMTRKVAIN